MNPESPIRQAVFVAGIFLLFGLIWFLLGDGLVAGIADRTAVSVAEIAKVKRWLFLFLATLLVSVLVYRVVAKRLQLERRLDSARLELGNLTHLAPVGLFRADRNGKVVFVNQVLQEIFGLDAARALGSGWEEAVHPEDRARVAARWREAVDNHSPDQLEFRLQNTEARTRWVLVRISVADGRVGGIYGFIGTVMDITALRAAQARIAELGEILDESLNEIYMFDADTLHFTYVNQGARTNLGYSRDELQQMTPLDVKPEFTRESFLQLVDPLRSGARQAISFKTLHRRKNGSTYPVEVSLQLHTMADKSQFVAIVNDVTSRKQTEAALNVSLNQYRDLVELSPLGVYRADASGAIVFASGNLGTMFGVDPVHLMGSGWTRYCVDYSVEEAEKTWLESVRKGQPYLDEYRIRRPDGSVIWVSDRGKPGIDPNGNLQGYVGTMEDITENKKVQLDIQRRSKLHTMLVQAEQVILHADFGDDNVFKEICRILVVAGGLRMAWIGLVDGKAGVVRVAGSAGHVEGYLDDFEISLVDPQQGRGPTATAVTSGRYVVSRDWHNDANIAPWAEAGEKRGYRSSAAFPISDGNRVIGVLNLYADEADFFGAEEIDRYGTLARDMGYARNYYQMEQARRSAERAAAESQSRLQLASEATQIGIWEYNPEENVVFYSPGLKAQLGYADDEMRNTFAEWEDRLHPEDHDWVVRQFDEFVRGARKEYETEYRLRHKDGSYRWILARGKLLRDQADKPVRVLGCHLDITERKLSEVEKRASEERLGMVLATSPAILYSMDWDGSRFQPKWISDSVTRVLGYPVQECLQPGWWSEHLHPEDRQRAEEIGASILENLETIQEYRFLDADGRVHWVRDEARITQFGDSGSIQIVGTWNDCSARRAAQILERLHAAAFESTRDGMVITDLNGDIISVNKAFMEITGYTESEVRGKNPRILSSGRQGPEFYQAMWNAILTSGHWQGEIWNRRKNGEAYPELLTVSVVRDKEGQPTNYVAVFTDISQIKATERQLEKIAHFDPLTQLPNRLLLQSRLHHALDQARRRKERVGILFIDLDDFKKVNDSLGHSTGDVLLTTIANRLQKKVRDEDTLGRLGGDEFLLVLEKLSRVDDAALVATNVQQAFLEPVEVSGQRRLHVNASIGISVYPDDGRNTEELLRNADTAMYRAKALGRGQFCFYTPDMNREVRYELELESALRQALARDEFYLVYQPKYRADNRLMVGAEALIRWRRADGRTTSPAAFIPVAEKSGLIVPVGEWVLDAAVRQAKHWKEVRNSPVRVAVNISARQFRYADMERSISAVLEKHDMEPDLLELELTESMLMDQPEIVAGLLMRLKRIGVKLSLDDFGTGYSSLTQLSRFPIDYVKIDASFVQSIGVDKSSGPIIDSILDLSHGLGMQVIAEGVETEAQYAYLRERGCDVIQGFLFSKPLRVEEFEKLFPLSSGKPSPVVAAKRNGGRRARTL